MTRRCGHQRYGNASPEQNLERETAMSTGLCRTISAVAAAAALANPGQAAAQQNSEALVQIMRDCAKIEIPADRFACYDSNFRDADASDVTPAPHGSVRPTQSRDMPSTESRASRDGQELSQVRSTRAAPDAVISGATLPVVAVVERAPGTYLVTLEGGAQWEFADSMGAAYNPPQRGSEAEMLPGALGGHRLRIDGQRPVRVRRVN